MAIPAVDGQAAVDRPERAFILVLELHELTDPLCLCEDVQRRPRMTGILRGVVQICEVRGNF